VTTVTVPAELSSVALREVSQPAVTLEMVGAVVSTVKGFTESLFPFLPELLVTKMVQLL